MGAPETPRLPSPAAGTVHGAVPNSQLDTLAVSVLVGCCLALGLAQVAIKVANTGISPLLQAGLRSIGATALLLAWARFRGVRLLARDGTLLPGLAVGILFAGEFAFLYVGLEHTTASRAVVLLYTAPLLVAAGAHLWLPADRLTAVKVLGLAAAFAGVLVVLLSGRAGGAGTGTLAGDLLCLVAAVCWGGLTLVGRATRLSAAAHEKVVLYQLGVSALLLPLLSLAFGEPGFKTPSVAALAALAYTIVIVAFVVYTAQYWLLTRYPASRVMSFMFLAPVFGVMWGGLILDEPLTRELWIGLAMVAVGIWLVNRRA